MGRVLCPKAGSLHCFYESCAPHRAAAGGRRCSTVAWPEPVPAVRPRCFCHLANPGLSRAVLVLSPRASVPHSSLRGLERKTEMKGRLRGDCGQSFPSCVRCKPALMRRFEKGGCQAGVVGPCVERPPAPPCRSAPGGVWTGAGVTAPRSLLDPPRSTLGPGTARFPQALAHPFRAIRGPLTPSLCPPVRGGGFLLERGNVSLAPTGVGGALSPTTSSWAQACSGKLGEWPKSPGGRHGGRGTVTCLLILAGSRQVGSDSHLRATECGEWSCPSLSLAGGGGEG